MSGATYFPTPTRLCPQIVVESWEDHALSYLMNGATLSYLTVVSPFSARFALAVFLASLLVMVALGVALLVKPEWLVW